MDNITGKVQGATSSKSLCITECSLHRDLIMWFCFCLYILHVGGGSQLIKLHARVHSKLDSR